MQPASIEFSGMNNNINPLLNHHHGGQFDPATPHDDFLEQMLSSVPSSAASYHWSNDHAPPQLEEQSLSSKMRQHQISSGGATAKALMFQQQLLLSRSLAAGNGGADGGSGLLPMPHGDHSDLIDGNSFKSVNPANDASIEALLNGLTGSLGQTSNQSPHFHHPHNFGSAGATAGPAMNHPAVSGGGVAGQPRQRVRARRGQATDPHSIAERLRRERIAERMKALQELVPNANKTDKASMLDEIIDYVKFLQLQVKVLSMSRLGGAAAVAPPVTHISSQGKSGNGIQTASSSNNSEGMTVTENQVAKLMEEDMGSAMQYLQGKGLCLMPISLATAISTATSNSRNPLAGGPTSPSISALPVHSANIGGGEPSPKDGGHIFQALK
ncbi:hypothetical protein ABFS83_10G125500 [Erythranthe nasuta]